MVQTIGTITNFSDYFFLKNLERYPFFNFFKILLNFEGNFVITKNNFTDTDIKLKCKKIIIKNGKVGNFSEANENFPSVIFRFFFPYGNYYCEN